MSSGRLNINIDIRVDFLFWALLPAVNINLHAGHFEFEWLCFGFYTSFNREQ